MVNKRKHKEGKDDPFAPFDAIISEVILADGKMSGNHATSRVIIRNRNKEQLALVCINRNSLNCPFKCNAKRVSLSGIEAAQITSVSLFHKCLAAEYIEASGASYVPKARKRFPKMTSALSLSGILSAYVPKPNDLSSSKGTMTANQLVAMVKKENPALPFSINQAKKLCFHQSGGFGLCFCTRHFKS